MEPHPDPTTPQTRVFTRTSKACRRCRRLRIKCDNQGASPPCEQCRRAKQDCHFAPRGETSNDRLFRRPRNSAPSAQSQASSASSPLSLAPQPSGLSSSQPGWEALPPHAEVIQGVKTLTSSYFQLGFLPKALFFEQLQTNPESTDVFLLFGILSVSARFTPSLVRRYHGRDNATQVFLDLATSLVQHRMFSPTMNSIQGFFLMSIAEYFRMHREETYQLPENASKQDVVYSEAARRTFWMLETFENLHSGSDSPIAFSYKDITVLLPCDEREFTFGIQPSSRAALIGTPPATLHPDTANFPSRSLFATLLQTHNLWGQVAKLVSTDAPPSSPSGVFRLDPSEYRRLSEALNDFESSVPPQHLWSMWNLRGFKAEGLDLAYLSAVMVLRLGNIILRRSHLQDILRIHSRHIQPHEQSRAGSWPTVAEQLFDNMLTLHEQITAFFDDLSPEQGYPALIVFCVYICGSLANHLQQQPEICRRVAPQAAEILERSVRGLSDLQSAWPLAKRWYMALCSMKSHAASDEPAPDLAGPGDSSVNANHLAASQGVGESEPCHTTDIQFSDPFLSDSMFEVFETYLWSDMNNPSETGTFGEVFAAAPE
ncbi:hypothetical protein G7046_g9515 [Stylonectria norvegica]|nr:hypothetical protein G7046_g9515 [Stylonectria norvegica]